MATLRQISLQSFRVQQQLEAFVFAAAFHWQKEVLFSVWLSLADDS